MGEKCLNKLNGMFSFVIYDKQNNKIFAARDRFGIKPLYYQLTKDDFKIASEIKAFTVFDCFKPVGYLPIIDDFLTHRYFDHSENTFFKSVKQLMPGELLKLDLNSFRLQKKKWYDLSKKPYNFASTDFEEEFKNLFSDSVKLRLRSDVEVGSCLSGGLDSSSVVCTADDLLRTNNHKFRLKTFTAAFKHKDIDETKFVKEIVTQRPIKNFKVSPIASEFGSELSELVFTQDAPVWSSSIFAQYKVFELAAKSNIKVTLDGQGGDELLGGYKNLYYKHLVKNHLQNYHILPLMPIAGKLKASFVPFLKEAINTMQLTNSVMLKPHRSKSYKPNITSIKDFSLYLFRYHLPALLHYTDRNSMAHSVETRLPFLDHRLVEFCINLPDMKKLDSQEKMILRHSMKGIIPDKIRNRKDKVGFATPQNIWMKKLKSDIQKSIRELADTEVFNISHLNKISNFAPEISLGEIMRLYTFNEWRKRFKIYSFND